MCPTARNSYSHAGARPLFFGLLETSGRLPRFFQAPAMRVRAKICGITRAADAHAAVAAGADALGFNFHPASPRYVDPERARDIIAELPPFITTVGLFVDASCASVRQAVSASGVQWVQFHGDETDAQCVEGERPFIKAIHVAAPVDGAALERKYPHAAAFL